MDYLVIGEVVRVGLEPSLLPLAGLGLLLKVACQSGPVGFTPRARATADRGAGGVRGKRRRIVCRQTAHDAHEKPIACIERAEGNEDRGDAIVQKPCFEWIWWNTNSDENNQMKAYSMYSGTVASGNRFVPFTSGVETPVVVRSTGPQ